MPEVTKLMTGRAKWITFRFLCSHALLRIGGAVLNTARLQIQTVPLNLPPLVEKGRGRQQMSPVTCLSFAHGVLRGSPRMRVICSESPANI